MAAKKSPTYHWDRHPHPDFAQTIEPDAEKRKSGDVFLRATLLENNAHKNYRQLVDQRRWLNLKEKDRGSLATIEQEVDLDITAKTPMGWGSVHAPMGGKVMPMTQRMKLLHETANTIGSHMSDHRVFIDGEYQNKREHEEMKARAKGELKHSRTYWDPKYEKRIEHLFGDNTFHPDQVHEHGRATAHFREKCKMRRDPKPAKEADMELRRSGPWPAGSGPWNSKPVILKCGSAPALSETAFFERSERRKYPRPMHARANNMIDNHHRNMAVIDQHKDHAIELKAFYQEFSSLAEMARKSKESASAAER
eukprot:gnl/TRDRNA2_/TRDRNA2_61470_c0_seq1.p1 gnl/TRDRNA2_/TRDRNA2_61470_c0~~gnl/TRDRNA2_/TRDRNA2_61470_c0_seq1.p1  ORF type:complete len:309 (+),score=62.05 gnl/TRDRNA2_/TRDRNA2_61470_c0_seq1:88-1014(+)